MPPTPLTATVSEQDPFTALLTYHQFAANHAKQSTGLKVRFEDFEHQLNQLYDAGFILVTLEDWMSGQIIVLKENRFGWSGRNDQPIGLEFIFGIIINIFIYPNHWA